MTGFDVDMIVDFADFAVTERAVGQNDFAVFLHQQQTVRRRYLPAEEAGSGLHDGNHPGYRDAIADLDDRCVGEFERLAFAIDGFDRGIGEFLVDRQRGLADGLAVRGDLIDAGRNVPRCIELTRIEFWVTAGQLVCELDGFLRGCSTS